MRVLLADDQVWLRSAVRLLLEDEPEIDIIGEAGEVQSLLATVAALCPDLILLDWELPGLTNRDGAQHLLADLHAGHPELHVIVLSGRPEAGRAALTAGADAFVSKADPPEHLLTALRAAKSSWTTGCTS
jgi:DNA-binding NarL/FixJ family response regulator